MHKLTLPHENLKLLIMSHCGFEYKVSYYQVTIVNYQTKSIGLFMIAW